MSELTPMENPFEEPTPGPQEVEPGASWRELFAEDLEADAGNEDAESTEDEEDLWEVEDEVEFDEERTYSASVEERGATTEIEAMGAGGTGREAAGNETQPPAANTGGEVNDVPTTADREAATGTDGGEDAAVDTASGGEDAAGEMVQAGPGEPGAATGREPENLGAQGVAGPKEVEPEEVSGSTDRTGQDGAATRNDTEHDAPQRPNWGEGTEDTPARVNPWGSQDSGAGDASRDRGSDRTSRPVPRQWGAGGQRPGAGGADRNTGGDPRGAGGTTDSAGRGGRAGAARDALRKARQRGGQRAGAGTAVRDGAKQAARQGARTAARQGANALSGGTSEVAIRAWKLAKRVAPVLGILALVMLMVIGGFLAAGANDGEISYSERAAEAEPVAEEYLAAYRRAGKDHDLPWTLLAAVGRVTTNHGRSAPSDLVEHGRLIDREPSRGGLPDGGSVAGGDAVPQSAPEDGTRIVLLGDSILQGTSSQIEGRLEPRWPADTTAETGIGIPKVTEWLGGGKADGAGVVVVQAGVNDVWQSTAPADLKARISAVKAATAGARCTVWVNLRESYGGKYTAMNARAKAFNKQLAQFQDAWGTLTIADFAASAAAVGDEVVQAEDGLHLNAAGNTVWVETVEAAVLGCLNSATISSPGAGVSSMYATDAKWGSYDCADKDPCEVNPLIGDSGGLAKGPLLLEPTWLKAHADGRNPQAIDDAAEMLAEALDETRDKLLDNDDANVYRDWREDPVSAKALWRDVLAQAPVRLPKYASRCSSGTAGVEIPSMVSPLSVEAGTVVLRAFGARIGNVVNNGADLKAPAGTAVLAAADGVVTVIDGYVSISHSAQVSTVYRGIGAISVKTGQRVTAGATIAKVANAAQGEADRPHLHLELYANGVTRDPVAHLAGTWTEDGGVSGTGTTVLDPQAGTPVSGSTSAPSTTTVPGATKPSTPGSGAGAEASTPSEATDPQAGVPVEPCSGEALASAGTDPAIEAVVGEASGTGDLVLPVVGVTHAQLYDSFGDPRSGGRTHQGIDIGANEGRPVVAAMGGKVVGKFYGGQPCAKDDSVGLQVSIAGEDGKSYYYGHFATITVAPDARVEAGQQLGTVGTTGNACTSGPHLHFSINENQEKVENPYPLLVKARIVDPNTGFISGYVPGGRPGTASQSIDRVLAFASFFGGIAQNDPDAGIFPGDVESVAGGTGGSQSEVEALIRAYFPAGEVQNAIAVAKCESGLRPGATNLNKDGSTDYGVFQLNDRGGLKVALDLLGEDPKNRAIALNAEWNIRAAAAYLDYNANELYSGWGPWVCAKKLKIVEEDAKGKPVRGVNDSTINPNPQYP